MATAALTDPAQVSRRGVGLPPPAPSHPPRSLLEGPESRLREGPHRDVLSPVSVRPRPRRSGHGGACTCEIPGPGGQGGEGGRKLQAEGAARAKAGRED